MPVFEAQKSKIRMRILTKHGIENETWWSPLHQNGWSADKIITGMLRRFKKNYLYSLTNVVQFYQGDAMIDQYKL